MNTRISTHFQSKSFLISGLSFSIVLIVIISCFSNYSAPDTPWFLKFLYTPLGLILNSSVYSAHTACYWHGFDFRLDYAGIYLKTLAFEFPFFWLASQRSFLKGLSFAAMANAITHPIVFFLIPCSIDSYLSALLISEVFAFTFEAWLIFNLAEQNRGRAALLILLGNFISWQIGTLF